MRADTIGSGTVRPGAMWFYRILGLQFLAFACMGWSRTSPTNRPSSSRHKLEVLDRRTAYAGITQLPTAGLGGDASLDTHRG